MQYKAYYLNLELFVTFVESNLFSLIILSFIILSAKTENIIFTLMAIVIIYYLVAILLFHFTVNSLENGLGRTPIMGWMAWTRFMCEIDCIKHPRDCIRYPV